METVAADGLLSFYLLRKTRISFNSTVVIMPKHDFSMLDLVKREVFYNSKDTFKVCIPAVIYIIQNNLFYVAASHLEAAVYMVSFSLYNYV